jgi:hypothetical protein
MVKETIKKIFPESLLRVGRNGYDAFGRLKTMPSAYFHPWRRDSIKRLHALKGIHQGERCFILGNGPSLQQTDLTLLKGEYTFGLNRIYLHFPQMGFQTSYFLSVNDLVIEQCADEIQALNMPRFVSWRSHQWLKPEDDLYFLYSTYTGPKFAKDVSGRMWEGATVTFMALQLAFHMGFEKVILIGVDHSFATKGKPNTTITSTGDDPNHFNPGYFGKGFRWQLPDLDTSEVAYTMARETYKAAGREVIDATIGGKLEVFRKVDYESLF